MAHPFSWPSYISHSHPLHSPHYDRDRDRSHPHEDRHHHRENLFPLPWSPPDRYFYHSPPPRTPSHHTITSTQPFDPTTSLLPSTHQPLAVGRGKDPKLPPAKPKMTFKAALESLENSNVKAHEFFSKFHYSFHEDISPKLRVYATRPSLDITWTAKIMHHESKSRSAAAPPQNPNDEPGPSVYNTEQSFLELQDELLRRCATTTGLKVPHWPLAQLDDLERRESAERMVAKLTSSIRHLTPNLQRCDRSVSAMQAALSEMVTISAILNCHEDAREGEGIRREENDVLEGEGET